MLHAGIGHPPFTLITCRVCLPSVPSTGVLLFVAVVSFFLSLWGSLSVVFPQLAFRIENILQLRSVELSVFGVVLHKLGGLFLIILAVAFPYRYQLGLMLGLPALLGALLPPLYFYRTRGVFIVQDITGEIVGDDSVGWV